MARSKNPMTRKAITLTMLQWGNVTCALQFEAFASRDKGHYFTAARTMDDKADIEEKLGNLETAQEDRERAARFRKEGSEKAEI